MQTPTKQTPKKRFCLCIPPDLAKIVYQNAKVNERSINREIIHMLKTQVKQENLTA